MGELSKTRRQEAVECDRELAALVSAKLEEFVQIGLRLRRMGQLYDELGFKTFEQYAKDRFGYRRPYAYQLMDAAELRQRLPDLPAVAGAVSASADRADGELAWNESQMRTLLRLKSPTLAVAVAREVVKEVKAKQKKGEKVNLGEIVRAHAKKELGPQPRPDPPGPDQTVLRWTGELSRVAAEIEEMPGEALAEFAGKFPAVTQDFAAAIERLHKAWQVA